MEYIYFMASLPSLELGTPPPVSSAEMLRAAGGVLREDHWEDLKAILADRPADVRSADARRCADVDTQLRNALQRIRAQRAGAPLAARPRAHTAFDARLETAAAEAMALESPLERELALDHRRWALLDELAAVPAFGAAAVFAYGFKLRLAEKWAAMDEDEGLRVADQAVANNLAGRIA